ncbi:Protein of unknown function [Gryllus bimaculatus]|nr:Protein of unknown function [Gryllus bimaculatus]
MESHRRCAQTMSSDEDSCTRSGFPIACQGVYKRDYDTRPQPQWPEPSMVAASRVKEHAGERMRPASTTVNQWGWTPLEVETSILVRFSSMVS